MIDNPNFSIVLPTQCNAKCEFCFWKPEPMSDIYFKNLNLILETLPENFRQISITGGEPTLNLPVLSNLIRSLKRDRWSRIVLTTNGTFLSPLIPMLRDRIDHINISRHHYEDLKNWDIFGTKAVPNTRDLENLIYHTNKEGIDVCLNCVLLEDNTDPSFTENFIKFAKSVGASKVSFRKDDRLDNLDPTMHEMLYDNWKVVGEGSCPVCRSKTQLINGVYVSWKAAMAEPSNMLGELYELIYHPNGRLTTDWKGKYEYGIRLIQTARLAKAAKAAKAAPVQPTRQFSGSCVGTPSSPCSSSRRRTKHSSGCSSGC